MLVETGQGVYAGAEAARWLLKAGFSVYGVPNTLHTQGINADTIKWTDSYITTYPTAWPQKRLLLDALLEDAPRPEHLLLCRSNFDKHLSHFIEELIHKDAFDKLLIAPSFACTLARMARTDGVVVEMSETGVASTAIYGGTVVGGSTFKTNTISGKGITNSLLQLLWEYKGYSIPGGVSYVIGDYVKRRFGFVCHEELRKRLQQLIQHTNILCTNTHVNLPDGSQIVVDVERFEPYERVFATERSIPNLLSETMLALDTWGRADLKDQVILSGGLKDTPGLRQRIERSDIRKVLSKTLNMSPELTEGSVQGGALLGSLLSTTRPDLWITQRDCEEQGFGRVAVHPFGFA